jgi:two-component system response regulator MtrA
MNLKKLRILLADDDPALCSALTLLLETRLNVRVVGDSSSMEDVFKDIRRHQPDIIILEDFNTQTEEIDFCRHIRAESVVPILLLTNKSDEVFQLEAYRAGVDECIPLPVSHRLFQAKVTAWMRRTRSLPMAALDVLQVSGLSLDPGRKRVTVEGKQVVRLSALETRLLYLLMAHPGAVFEADHLIEQVWGYSGAGAGDGNLLKNLVYRVRRKIEPDPSRPRYLLTEANGGYKFSG